VVANILVGMLCGHLLCFAVMFLLISRRLDGQRMGMDVFAMGNLLLGSAYVLQLVEGGPNWSAMSVIGHVFTLAAPIAYWIGGMRFFGYSTPLWRPLAAFALVYAGVQWLVQWNWGLTARYAMLSAMSALLFVAMTLTAIQGARTFAKDRFWEMLFFALLIGGICTLNAFKFAKILNGGLEALNMDSGFQTVFYIYMCSLATVAPPAIIWLVLRRLTDDLSRVAARDPMTQLLNRRGLAEALRGYFNLRNAAPAYLLLLDIDHFKRINDTHGHQAGDAVLCHVADVLRTTMRQGDLTGRIGGEEFVAICLDSNPEGVAHLAERLRAAVESQGIPVQGTGALLHCTVTIGVSHQFASPDALEGAMRDADAALYRGKVAGRNRVELAPAAISRGLAAGI
jgi:diguanylate cyclase (GGDEF)-like protein